MERLEALPAGVHLLVGSLARERELGGGEQVCVGVRGLHYFPWIPARVRGSTIT